LLCASAYCHGNGRCQARAGVYSFPRGPFAFLRSLAASPATSALAFIDGCKSSQQWAHHDRLEIFLCGSRPYRRDAPEGIQRLVVVSAGGAGESVAHLSRPVRWLVNSGQIGVAYRDLENMERELASSGPDWLAIRPVTLIDGPPTGAAHPAPDYGMFSKVRRSDVAGWMLSRSESPEPFEPRTVLLGTQVARSPSSSRLICAG
jgi:hypothetical protein